LSTSPALSNCSAKETMYFSSNNLRQGASIARIGALQAGNRRRSG
jgi:hypothetical protein